MSTSRLIYPINESTSKVFKLFQKSIGDTEVFTVKNRQCWSKIAKLDIKLANVLKGNKTNFCSYVFIGSK